MPHQGGFNAHRVAFLEKSGWEAYYARNWLRVLRLMVQLNREEFGMSLPVALASAFDVVRASLAFAPLDNDVPRATAHLQRYYARARRSAGIAAGASTLASLEMRYWIVHRDLARERAARYAVRAPQAAPDASQDSGSRDDHGGLDDIEEMVVALAALHSALIGSTPDMVRRSAEQRALAAKTVDRITGGYSTDVRSDWDHVEHYLCEAYKALPLQYGVNMG